MAGNDPGFHNCRKFLVLDRVGDVDLSLSQEFAELLPAPIFADQTGDRNLVQELAQIARDIGRATGKETFAGHFDDRHWRLRRNSADLAPDKFVQHQVADDQDALGRRAIQNLPKPF